MERAASDAGRLTALKRNLAGALAESLS